VRPKKQVCAGTYGLTGAGTRPLELTRTAAGVTPLKCPDDGRLLRVDDGKPGHAPHFEGGLLRLEVIP
jgi:hypothetical protein